MESEITTLCFASKLRFWLGRLILALAAAGGDIACRWLGLIVVKRIVLIPLSILTRSRSATATSGSTRCTAATAATAAAAGRCLTAAATAAGVDVHSRHLGLPPFGELQKLFGGVLPVRFGAFVALPHGQLVEHLIDECVVLHLSHPAMLVQLNVGCQQHPIKLVEGGHVSS